MAVEGGGQCGALTDSQRLCGPSSPASASAANPSALPTMLAPTAVPPLGTAPPDGCRRDLEATNAGLRAALRAGALTPRALEDPATSAACGALLSGGATPTHRQVDR